MKSPTKENWNKENTLHPGRAKLTRQVSKSTQCSFVQGQDMTELVGLSKKTSCSYVQLLMRSANTRQVIDKFCEEPSYLKASDVGHKTFAPGDCLERMKSGYSLLYFDYLTGTMREVHMSIQGTVLVLDVQKGSKKIIQMNKVCGLLLNAESSTFRKVLNIKLSTLGINSYDAFSIVTHQRTFDVASNSDSIKYDVCISVMALAAEFSPFRVVPVTKRQITILKLKKKIEEMASERSLFVKELFIVRNIQIAIAKIMHQRGEHDKLIVLQGLLKRLTGERMHIYRLITKAKPQMVKTNAVVYRDIFDRTRMLELRKTIRLKGMSTKFVYDRYLDELPRNHKKYTSVIKVYGIK